MNAAALRVVRLVIAAALTFLPSTGMHADGDRQDTPGGGWILGQAIDANTRKGVPGALIVLVGGAVRHRALTTPDGHYIFLGLPSGTYHITASKTGYVAGGHGMRRPNGSVQPITLNDGERVADATVVMWKDAAISGTVLDEAGEPVVGLRPRHHVWQCGARPLIVGRH